MSTTDSISCSEQLVEEVFQSLRRFAGIKTLVHGFDGFPVSWVGERDDAENLLAEAVDATTGGEGVAATRRGSWLAVLRCGRHIVAASTDNVGFLFPLLRVFDAIVSGSRIRCERCGYDLTFEVYRCPRCGREVPFTTDMCPFCGEPLVVKKCPSCGARVTSTGKLYVRRFSFLRR